MAGHERGFSPPSGNRVGTSRCGAIASATTYTPPLLLLPPVSASVQGHSLMHSISTGTQWFPHVAS
jgi:hypothetical protein